MFTENVLGVHAQVPLLYFLYCLYGLLCIQSPWCSRPLLRCCDCVLHGLVVGILNIGIASIAGCSWPYECGIAIVSKVYVKIVWLLCVLNTSKIIIHAILTCKGSTNALEWAALEMTIGVLLV